MLIAVVLQFCRFNFFGDGCLYCMCCLFLWFGTPKRTTILGVKCLDLVERCRRHHPQVATFANPAESLCPIRSNYVLYINPTVMIVINKLRKNDHTSHINPDDVCSKQVLSVPLKVQQFTSLSSSNQTCQWRNT